MQCDAMHSRSDEAIFPLPGDILNSEKRREKRENMRPAVIDRRHICSYFLRVALDKVHGLPKAVEVR